MMFASVLRFWLKGWITELYVKPQFFFKYYGFEWVEVPNEQGLYFLFALVAISSLFVMLGLFYRISSVAFFLSFTYVELLDKTNYLNHYYFVSIVALLMIFLPAGKYFSLDVRLRLTQKITHVQRWLIVVIQLQLGIVYFFAGLAKLNYDWLINAQPLRIWLQPHTDMPVIGFLMDKIWLAYFFSWFGAVYDLTIPFFLLNKRTRYFAYATVIAFHVLTAILFPIGMFPYVMIVSTLIFFPAQFHLKIIAILRSIFTFFKSGESDEPSVALVFRPTVKKILISLFVIHFIFQVIIPFRFLLYPGNLFWTEQGFRFSWRVMLIEKAGKAFFHVRDPDSNREGEVMMNNYLTPNQEKMMATQPDMILQYARFLEKKYEETGMRDPQITVESYVTLNGKGSRLFINRYVDLTRINDSFTNKWWILPLEEK
jgi:hypothetical protein